MATAEDQPTQGVGDRTVSAKRKTLDEIQVDLALPEPPSKRARRALKKGKPLPTKNESGDEKKEDTAREDEDADLEIKDKRPRSEHGIWVGNLPFTVTATELKQWLVDNSGGVITNEAITRIKLPTYKDTTGDKGAKATNKGFAYVDLVDMGSKVAAIALSETELSHRKLLIKDAKSFDGRPAKERGPKAVEIGPDGKPQRQQQQKNEVDANASRKLFVGNMSFQTTEEDVRRNFEKCGQLEWVKVATFEDTGKCKGYGWVMFKEPEAAAWAVKGFVKIKEAVETEADFQDDDAENDVNTKEEKQKQFKTRKWWVNRMLGRQLKLELAEDDQLRYKKRFGKDAAKRSATESDSASRPEQRRRHKDTSRDEGTGDFDKSHEQRSDDVKAAKPLPSAADIQVARLTGGVVQHTGTKVLFD